MAKEDNEALSLGGLLVSLGGVVAVVAWLAGAFSARQPLPPETPATAKQTRLQEVVCGAFFPAHRALHARVEGEVSNLLLGVLSTEETGDPEREIPAGRGPAFGATLSALSQIAKPVADKVVGAPAPEILKAGKDSILGLVASAAKAQKKFDTAFNSLPAGEQQAIRHLFLLQEMPHFPPLPQPGSGGSPLENLLISFVTEHVAKHSVLTQQATVAVLQAIEQVKRPASRQLLLKVLEAVNAAAAREVVRDKGQVALTPFRDEEALVLARHKETKATVVASHQALAPDQRGATVCLVN